jgi:hypothetical protein
MLDNNTGVLLSLSVIMSLPPVAPCYRCIMLLLLSQIIIYLILSLCNLYIFINCNFIILDSLLSIII